MEFKKKIIKILQFSYIHHNIKYYFKNELKKSVCEFLNIMVEINTADIFQSKV